MVGLFLLDLALPRNIPLLPYYFLVVVLSASLATPRQMVPLIVQAYGLAIASGLFWGFFPSIDYLARLLALTGVSAVAFGPALPGNGPAAPQRADPESHARLRRCRRGSWGCQRPADPRECRLLRHARPR